MSKITLKVWFFVALVLLLAAPSALAQHFEVGGKENGPFTITGTMELMMQPNCTITGELWGQGEPGQPPPEPVLEMSCVNGGFSPPCKVTMNGVVTNGQAQINNVSLVGTVSCYRTQIRGLPWPLLPTGQLPLNAQIRNAGLFAPAEFDCENVTMSLNLGNGFAGIGGLTGQNCSFVNNGDASTVTPALTVVP